MRSRTTQSGPRALASAAGETVSCERLEARQMLYGIGGGDGESVHQWITSQGIGLFFEQFGASQLKSTKGSFENDVVGGARAEDEAFANPFGDSAPYLRHFWGHDAGFGHGLNNGFVFTGIRYTSAPQRATEYFNATGFGSLGWDGGGIARRYDAADSSTYQLSYQLLGHVAHLLQDMTVPAHAHNDYHGPGDTDPFHDWIDGKEIEYRDPAGGAAIEVGAGVRHTQFAIPAGSAVGAQLRSLSQLATGVSTGRFSADALVKLFRENVTLSDDYDSRSDNGQSEKGQARRGGRYDAYTQDQFMAMGRVLVPRAIASTAELIRLFYGTVDDEAPKTVAGNLKSKDPAAPQSISGSTFDLIAMASDEMTGNSGVGKDKFIVEYQEVVGGTPSGGWKALDRAGSTKHFNSAGTDAPANMELDGQSGAQATYRFQGVEGSTYQVRIRAEDGAGNQTKEADAPVYYIRMGPASASIVQVIDRSGSMDGAKIAAARTAAGLFTQLLAPGDRVGVATFDDFASTLVGLTTIDADLGNIDPIVQAINGIQPGGATAIGLGLQEAESILTTISGEVGQSIVLLSDGQNNSGINPDVVAQRLAAAGIRVFTIAFGSDADDVLLARIASTTGGKFYDVANVTALNEIYAAIVSPLTGVAQPLNASGTVGTGQTQSQTVSIGNAQQATFGLNWQAGASGIGNRAGATVLGLRVTSPSGLVYAAGAGEVVNEQFDTLAAWNRPSAWWGLRGGAGLNGSTAATESPFGNYPNNADLSLTLRQAVTVPSEGAMLRFWHQYAFEQDYDYGRVEVSAAGGAWTEVMRYTGTGDAEYAEISLAAYAGQSVQVRFRVTSDGFFTDDGWTIDDVRLSAPSAEAEGVHIYQAGNYTLIRIDDPMPGEWAVSVDGVNTPPAGQAYSVFSFLNTGAIPGLAVSNADVTERALVRTSMVFNVTLSAASATPVTVKYRTLDGTAIAGVDYEAASGELTFKPGEVSKRVVVRVLADTDSESAETLSLQLEDAAGGVIADPLGEGTIREGAFRVIDFGGAKTASYTDGDGQVVTVSIQGKGRGQLLVPLVGDGVEAILVSRGNQNSRLTLTTNRPTEVPTIDVSGNFGSIDAALITLTGGLIARGGMKSVVLGDVSAPDGVSFAGTLPLNLTFGRIQDSVISAAGAIAKFTATSWTRGSELVDALSAASIGDILIAGDLEANVSSTTTLKSLIVRGAVRSAVINAVRGITQAEMKSLVDSRIVVGRVDDGSLPDAVSDFSVRSARLGVLKIATPARGASFVGSVIVAPRITSLSLGRISPANAGLDLGATFRSCGTLNGRYVGGRPFTWTRLDRPSESVQRRDFSVTVLG